ncbi:serine/threonine-protein kinase Nek11-like protein [Cricetulus griseus]|nr:serine/threonine-protein kinase Nek11-like protein [Cricetulus griseus]
MARLKGIPEDPLVAEEYYADVFDSCSEESEELEEETVFLEAEGEMRDKGTPPAYRANQQGTMGKRAKKSINNAFITSHYSAHSSSVKSVATKLEPSS